MIEKINLVEMLEEIRKEDAGAEAPKKKSISQDEIRAMLAQRRKNKNGMSRAES